MKKLLLGLLLAGSCFFSTDALAANSVVWDGAEVVYGQVGKMTFSKDVKVYKSNIDGTFTSLVVKKRNFFRVYGVKNSSVGIVYNMSGGYRVQATDLVIYREVPSSIQRQLGTIFRKGSTLYVPSPNGVAILSEPNSGATSLSQTKQGSIVQTIETAGDYVKVIYNPGQGEKAIRTGYIPKNSLEALPMPQKQYVIDDTKFRQQVESIETIGFFSRGQEVLAYHTTLSGFTCVSLGQSYVFIETSSFSKNKITDKHLQQLDDPASVAFDLKKEIWYGTNDSPSNIGRIISGTYKPGTSNTLDGQIIIESGEYYKTLESSFQVISTNQKLVYKIDEMTITIPFPLKIGDAIDVNGKKHKVEKILEKSKPIVTYSGETIKNAIFAGDLVIGKDYLYKESLDDWKLWYYTKMFDRE